MTFSKISDISKKLKKLPNSPGVYIFKNEAGKILYVGKATSLKERVSSYFKFDENGKIDKNKTILNANRPVEYTIDSIFDISIKKTETVLEAYILEQDLIKKLQPKYNAMGKDDKSFCYIVLTKEDFPKFVIIRQRELDKISKSVSDKNLKIKNFEIKKIYGPFISKKNVEIVLKIARKIFPYHGKIQNMEKGCLEYQIGLCPGPHNGSISKKEYARNIYGIKMILEGKKKSLLSKLKKEMEEYSLFQEYEKALETRNKIFALQHIQDMALISQEKNDNFFPGLGLGKNIKYQKINARIKRIEGYDISNISGRHNVASMVVFDNSEGEIKANKSQYRKFKIKTVKGANDVGAMEEILARRFKNNWSKPSLIILDGGQGHLNVARKVLRNYKMEIPLLAVAKGRNRKKLDIRTFGNISEISKDLVEKVRNEAHRFAISYHKKIRDKKFLN